LSRIARKEGAGSVFSAATVFALKEYESWLIAGVEALAGKLLPRLGRPGVVAGTVPPADDLEVSLRDAKSWLGKHMKSGYKPTTDQEPLTALLVANLDPLRSRGLRSFRQLEKALGLLTEGFRLGNHVVTPHEPPA
jgi:hypothetical protein